MMTDAREAAIRDIGRAVRLENMSPQHYAKVMRRHRKEWPALWAAIDDLLESSE